MLNFELLRYYLSNLTEEIDIRTNNAMSNIHSICLNH